MVKQQTPVVLPGWSIELLYFRISAVKAMVVGYVSGIWFIGSMFGGGGGWWFVFMETLERVE